MTEKLKPCPFCGGEPFMVDAEIDGRVYYIVKCGTCHCTSGVMQMSRPAAAEAWNRRVERTCPDSWKQLEKDIQRIAGGGVCGYYGKAGKPCGDCPAQRTQDNCMLIVVRDVMRRTKALAGRDAND